jgi:hypothetical protein
MFRASINAPLLKAVVTVLKDFTDVATLCVDADGISTEAMEPGNVCMVRLRLAPGDMESFAVVEAGTFTVPVATLDKMLKSAKKTVALRREATSTDASDAVDVDAAAEAPLHVEYRGDGGDLAYVVPPAETDTDTTDVPDLGESKERASVDGACDVCLNLSATQLNKICTDLKVVGQETDLLIHDDATVHFRGRGETRGHRCAVATGVTARRDDGAAMVAETAKFQLSYVQTMCKLYRVCDIVTIRLRSQEPVAPLCFRFRREAGGSHLMFTLATMVCPAGRRPTTVVEA